MSSHLTSPIAPTHHLDASVSPSTSTGAGNMPPPPPKHLPPRHALRKSYTEAQRERQRQKSRTGGDDAQETALDIEFEQAWETTSDWNEDDVDAVNEEWNVCWGDEEMEGYEAGNGEGGNLEGPTGMGGAGHMGGGHPETPTNGRGRDS